MGWGAEGVEVLWGGTLGWRRGLELESQQQGTKAGRRGAHRPPLTLPEALLKVSSPEKKEHNTNIPH